MKIRPTRLDDIPSLKIILEGTGLFPPEILPDLLSGFLDDAGCDDRWFTCEDRDTTIGFCYARPEPLTEGTWNMLAIAVLPEKQGIGAGKAIVRRLEKELRRDGQRVLIAETSGTDAFERTRAFYRQCGYAEEARIRDFWAAGDDKIVFWKSLQS